MENTFWELGVPEALCRGLLARGIRRPTHIQTQAWAPIRAGKDLLAEAETGSGKTLAYLVPVLAGLNWEEKSPQALVLTPTHELAAQVERVARLLGEAAGLPLRTALLIGGASRERQVEKLKAKPQLLIGSAGRVLDLYRAHKLKMAGVHTLVLDEADRLMTLEPDNVAAVVKTTLRDRQLLAFSASLNGRGREAAQALMKPEPVEIRPLRATLPKTIRQGYVVTDFRQKVNTLRKVLAAEAPERALVFLNNPENLQVVTEKLRYHGLKAAALFGQDKKEGRRVALNDFREGRVNILLCTDLAARGLDFPGLTHVVQMDAPEDPVQYQHRVGRCGRQGAAGTAILLLTPGQVRWVRTYEKTFGVHIGEMSLGYGRLIERPASEKRPEKPTDKPRDKGPKPGERRAHPAIPADKPHRDEAAPGPTPEHKGPKPHRKGRPPEPEKPQKPRRRAEPEGEWEEAFRRRPRTNPWDGMKTTQKPKRNKPTL